MKTIKRIDSTTVEVDGKRYLLETSKEPKFEVGKWYYCSEYSIPNQIFRITLDEGTWVYYDCHTGIHGRFAKLSCIYQSSVPATKEQIESHLREVLVQKGFKEGIKVKHMERDSVFTLERSKDWRYSEMTDSFHCCISGSEWEKNYSNPQIYSKGKFAEIVVNDSKKQSC